MNQKLTFSLLGLTLAVVATLAIAPIVSELAYADLIIKHPSRTHNQLNNNTYDYTINKKLNLEGKKSFKLDEGSRGGIFLSKIDVIRKVIKKD